MTPAAWKEEVQRALSGAGAPWGVRDAWIEVPSGVLCADLSDTRTGKECQIRLTASDRFSTVAARRAEIVRQAAKWRRRQPGA